MSCTRPLVLICIILLGKGYGQENTTQPADDDLASRFRPESSPLIVKYSWSEVDFVYSSEEQKKQDILTGKYIPQDVIIIDVDAYTGRDGIKREYVTTPNFRPGIPFSLSMISNEQGKGGPKLIPFPNEQWHDRSVCDSIISAFRIRIDSVGRMWVMDTGKLESSTNRRTRCGPQLLAFDMNNNNALLRKVWLPVDSCNDRSFFVNLEVEVGVNDTWVYMSDPNNHFMAVYTMSTGNIFYLQHPFFYPDPLYAFYSLNGVNFTLIDGVLGLALTKDPATGADVLFFNGLSSGRENYVKTEILKDQNRAESEEKEYKTFPFMRGTHVTVKSITKGGVMIFPSLDDNSLFAWDIRTEFAKKNFKLLARDKQNLQFPSGMKIIGNEVYVLTSRLQNPIGLGSPARGEVNYRVVTLKLDKLSKPSTNKLVFS